MKERADKLLVTRGLAPTREKAQALIMAGLVLSGDRPVAKAGQPLDADAPLRLKETLPFVGRGGMKLAEALRRFAIDVAGRVAADVGSSTGGFTDCLLQAGARKVYAVDVDTRQLDARLRSDPRVATVEKNARYLAPADFPEPPSVVTVDVSFISVTKLFAALRALAGLETLLVLVKPQFEAGKGEVGRGKGIVRDAAVHEDVLRRVLAEAAAAGFACRGLMRCATRGAKGNVEFFGWFVPDGGGLDEARVRAWIEEAVHGQAHP